METGLVILLLIIAGVLFVGVIIVLAENNRKKSQRKESEELSYSSSNVSRLENAEASTQIATENIAGGKMLSTNRPIKPHHIIMFIAVIGFSIFSIYNICSDVAKNKKEHWEHSVKIWLNEEAKKAGIKASCESVFLLQESRRKYTGWGEFSNGKKVDVTVVIDLRDGSGIMRCENLYTVEPAAALKKLEGIFE